MDKKAFAEILALLLILLLMPSANSAENSSPIVVTGWPLELKFADKAVLSGDSIMRSLACPSLTRLNLLTKRSELVLLEKLEQTKLVWRLTLASDLRWWDQSPVSMQEFEEFIHQSLLAEIQNKNRPGSVLPKFTLSSEKRTLIIQWASQPDFGPYILNRLPLQKKTTSKLGLLCAGAWRAEEDSQGIVLQNSRVPLQASITIASSTDIKRSPGAALLAFRFGEELPETNLVRPLDEAIVCPLQIDTPIFTVIAWNPNGPVTGDARFRRAMTHLIPRGALLRAGTGHLGDLVSAPILRSHPGYNRRLLVPNYDPQKADTILNELGYKRTPEEGFRRNAEGQALEIKLLVRNSAGSGLLRKVLDDGFRALGIKLKFIDESEGVPDGLLTGIMGSWPDSDLGPWLNSRQSESIWPWRYQDAKLDEALEAYARSLTEASPNFGLLEKVHELVYKLEPFSVLMQHRVCLDAQWPEKRLPPGEITLRDPEWFRNFIGL